MSDDVPESKGSQKPAILQDQEFVVEEGILYKTFRTGAIWMNKLFFSSVVLLAIWLIVGLTGAIEPGCTASLEISDEGETAKEQCSVWLSPTSIYLGSMSVFSFLLSIVFGLLGLVVGKNVIAMTPSDEEVGAGGGHDRDD